MLGKTFFCPNSNTVKKKDKRGRRNDRNIIFMTDNADIGGCGLYVLSRQEWMEAWIESRRAVIMYVFPHGKEYQQLVKFSPLMQIKPDLDQLGNNKWTIRLFRLNGYNTQAISKFTRAQPMDCQSLWNPLVRPNQNVLSVVGRNLCNSSQAMSSLYYSVKNN